MADAKVRGITIELGADTSGISKALGSLNKEISQTSKELKDVERLLKLDPGNTELLAQKQKLLTKAIEDSEKKVEDDYLKYIPGEIDILKVAHHGSDTSSGAKLLEAIDPDYAVLSLGAGNDYNHPHKEPMERLQNCGAEIYRTDRSGTITFTVKEGEISVATER